MGVNWGVRKNENNNAFPLFTAVVAVAQLRRANKTTRLKSSLKY